MPDNHIKSNQAAYARYGIQRIDVRLGGDISGLADYAIKSIANGKADEKDIIAFPRPVKELPTKRKFKLDPMDRLLKDIQSSLNVSDEMSQQIREDLIKTILVSHNSELGERLVSNLVTNSAQIKYRRSSHRTCQNPMDLSNQ
jgi:hypothetical protein